MVTNAAESLDILATAWMFIIISILFSDLYLAKFLDTSVKPFYSFRVLLLEILIFLSEKNPEN